MRKKPVGTWRPRQGRTRHLAATALAASVVGLLAALPTAPATASTPSISGLPTGEVESVLGQIPLGQLEVPELTEALSKLPGFEGLTQSSVKKALTETINGLVTKEADLGELLKGGEGGEAVSKLESKLKGLLGGLFSLLGGNPTKKITETLGSSSATELLGKQLGTSLEPEKLIAELLATLNPETLKGLLGSGLAGAPGEPFAKQTVEQLASQLEMTSQTLAGDVGKTATELTKEALALTSPLTSGKELAVLDGVKGLTLGLLEKGTGVLGGGGTGGSGGGGNGGTGGGGNGGPGGSSGGGGTIVLEETNTQPGTAPATTSSLPAGKLKIISHRVKGGVAQIVVQVPSAGKLATGGKNLRSVRRETAKAERVTIQAVLDNARASALRKHHRSMKVPVKVSFKQAGGPSSSATVSVLFH
jgi:hypothetical protein